MIIIIKKLKYIYNKNIVVHTSMFQGKLNLPMNLQQINVISAEAFKAFLYTFFDICSINPQNLRIVTYIT